MYDMHFDLLTILYSAYTKNTKIKKDYILTIIKKMYNENIKGGIINLYFMSEKEMKEELDIEKKELNVVKMLKKSINILKKIELLKDINFIYSIEGCDFLKIKDLKKLYKLGIRSIMPVWNNKNQYGSGIRENSGLSEKGKLLIKKMIKLNIIIDVSHANEKTFDDIINIVNIEKNKNKKINIIASHSNCYSLCNKKRNLTDEQLIKFKEAGGTIGIFTNLNFISDDYLNKIKYNKEINFIKHLSHVINNLEFDTNKIVLSTDDMSFMATDSYLNSNCFELDNLTKDIKKILKENFGEKITHKIMYENASNLINKVTKN